MVAVQIAQLKNNLSAYLKHVRRGEEVVISDRKTPIAKIVPYRTDDLEEEERELVAAGILRIPDKPFDVDAFFAIGKGIRTGPKLRKALARAMEIEREGVDVGILGRKRRRVPVRPRSSK